MSTSCLYGFCKNGEYKVTYNHFDSYPEGFGQKVVAFIRENSLEELNELCDTIKIVDRKKYPTEAELQTALAKNIYCIDRENVLIWSDIEAANGGYLKYYLSYNFMCDYTDWLHSREWLYIIDLDENKFIVYYNRYKDMVSSWKDRFEVLGSYPLNQIPRTWAIEIKK